MARLVRYVVAAEGGLDPRSWQRTADYMLCSKTNNRGEKVGGVRVTNCNTDDPAAATTLIEATQAANTTSATDKTYHLVFSFPPGEQPSLEVLHKIEDALCEAIGYKDHQRISAVHIDTDHLHVHVAINKVRQIGKNFNNITPKFDKLKLMEACERLELEYGLIRTNHGLHGEKPKAQVKSKQAEAEAHGGIQTIAGLVSRELAPRLKEAKSWKEAREVLAEHGLEIKCRGAGLVIGSGDVWVKASQCDRGLSFKAMTDRLGALIEISPTVTKPYEPKPHQRHHAAPALFEQYQAEKTGHSRLRERVLARLKYEAEFRDYKIKKWHVAQRAIIKTTAPGPGRAAKLKILGVMTESRLRANWADHAIKRQKLTNETAAYSWPVWLSQQAEQGNVEALEVLRSRQEREQMRGDYLTSKDPGTGIHFVVSNLNGQVSWKGEVTYSTSDGGVVVDRSGHVQCLKTTAKSSQLALELATMRFSGQVLIVEGQESFQKEVARLAKLRGIEVRFTKPAIKRTKTKGQEAEL